MTILRYELHLTPWAPAVRLKDDAIGVVTHVIHHLGGDWMYFRDGTGMPLWPKYPETKYRLWQLTEKELEAMIEGPLSDLPTPAKHDLRNCYWVSLPDYMKKNVA